MAVDIAGKFLELICGGLGPAAAAVIPRHWRDQAVARIADVNAFSAIAGNHDLIRAVRIAWVEAALAVLNAARNEADAAQTEGDGGRADVARLTTFVETVQPRLTTLRDRALNRGATPGDNPIDRHVTAVLRGTPEFIAPGQDTAVGDPLTRDFIPILAPLAWPDKPGSDALVPPIIGQLAREGIPSPDGGPRRDFGTLVFDAFTELIKDPKRYPEAAVAFQIDMLNAARTLAETILDAVRGLDAGMDARLNETIGALMAAQRDQLARDWRVGLASPIWAARGTRPSPRPGGPSATAQPNC